LAQIAVSKHSEHMPLNRQAVVMARHGVPIDRSVLADWMGRTGALIAPVVDHMAKQLLAGSTRLYVDETTAPVLEPGKGKTKTGYLWAVLRDDRGWNGPAPPGVVFHYRPGRKGEYAAKILDGFNGTIQVPSRQIASQSPAGQRMPMAAIAIWPRRNARAAIRCGWPSAGRMADAS
jgi:transposase